VALFLQNAMGVMILLNLHDGGNWKKDISAKLNDMKS